MPSPIGHGIIGLSIALFSVPPQLFKDWAIKVFWVVFLACLPDVDLIFGLLFGGDLNVFHRAGTHSLVFGFIAPMLVLLVSPFAGWKGYGLLLLASMSHLLADLFGIDPTPPIGIQLFWPMSEGYFIAPFTFFPALSKETVGDMFQWANVSGLLKEATCVLPLFIMSLFWARKKLYTPQ